MLRSMLIHGWVQTLTDLIPSGAAIVMLVVIGLVIFGLWRTISGLERPKQDGQQQDGQQQDGKFVEYGHLIIVSLGIVTVLVAFLVTLLFSAHLFKETSQALALLTALFGVIGTLVGTYFGIKASTDATEAAQAQTRTAQQQLHDHLKTQQQVRDSSLTIDSVAPPSDAAQVEPDTPIRATFSDEVDTASIKGTYHFTLVRVDPESKAHTPVSGDVYYGPPDYPPRVAAFVPKGSRLDKDRTYHATITKGVLDLTGNTLAAPFTWQFKT